jgi:hypothetical protein
MSACAPLDSTVRYRQSMSYTLQAFIGDAQLMDGGLVGDAAVRPLHASLAILPLVQEVAKRIGIPSLALTDEEFNALPAICEVGARLSKSGRVVYVGAEFLGGVGTQANCLFENGILVSKPTIHKNAINEALKFLGVEVAGATDEFATVRLWRHRNTDGWVSDT